MEFAQAAKINQKKKQPPIFFLDKRKNDIYLQLLTYYLIL